MTQMMTRSKVQILFVPDLEQTAAQPPGEVNADLEDTEVQSLGYMLEISSRGASEKESVNSSKGRQPMYRCQTCLKHENGKRAKDSTKADPQTKTAAFSRKTVHSNK